VAIQDLIRGTPGPSHSCRWMGLDIIRGGVRGGAHPLSRSSASDRRSREGVAAELDGWGGGNK
jgi:hypothetical protein